MSTVCNVRARNANGTATQLTVYVVWQAGGNRWSNERRREVPAEEKTTGEGGLPREAWRRYSIRVQAAERSEAGGDMGEVGRC